MTVSVLHQWLWRRRHGLRRRGQHTKVARNETILQQEKEHQQKQNNTLFAFYRSWQFKLWWRRNDAMHKIGTAGEQGGRKARNAVTCAVNGLLQRRGFCWQRRRDECDVAQLRQQLVDARGDARRVKDLHHAIGMKVVGALLCFGGSNREIRTRFVSPCDRRAWPRSRPALLLQAAVSEQRENPSWT